MTRDNIYSLPRDRVGDFTFDEEVVRVFPDMISRSVPGYASILSMIEQLANRFVQPNTNVYDLGCSLGAATVLMRRQVPVESNIVAIDNSPAMVARLKSILAEQFQSSNLVRPVCPVEVVEADICAFPMENASFVVLNLTLQFVRSELRSGLLKRVYDALKPGGALLLSEKICFEDPGQQDLLNELHHDFKRANGYSDLEIAQKRTSLENRMIPESLGVHFRRLHEVGFEVVAPWFQCFNFASILAVKSSTKT